MCEKVIELKNVAVIYKEHQAFFKTIEYQALKDVSFNVYKSEVLGVIGRNGAGKSTLLRLLAGIIKPDKGTITHNASKISLMALAAGFDRNLSGYQNTILSGMLIGYSKKEILAKIDSIFEFSELQDFFYKPTKYYSSGMRARLAFSIAMYISPDVLLIDEVLGVGDASFKQKAEQALEDKINSDITVIIVSHSEKQIKQMSQRLIWIDGGLVRQEGVPDDVFPEYKLNINFSSLGLKVSYENSVSDKYIISFFNVIKREGHLFFDCSIISKNHQSIEKVTCYSSSLDDVIEASAEASPRAFEDYPEYTQAKNAKFTGFETTILSDTILECEYGEILKFKIIEN